MKNPTVGYVCEYDTVAGIGMMNTDISFEGSSKVIIRRAMIKISSPKFLDALDNFDEHNRTLFWYLTARVDEEWIVSEIITIPITEYANDTQIRSMKSTIDWYWSNYVFIDEQPLFASITEQVFGSPAYVAFFRKKRFSIRKSKRERSERDAQNEYAARLREEERQTRLEAYNAKQKRERRLGRSLNDEEHAKEAALEILRADEFSALVQEVKSMNFTTSSELSNYIINRKLGIKYSNISGYVEMSSGDKSWVFQGGFAPEVYSNLCRELGLVNQGTRSDVVGFTPFSSVIKTT